MKQKYFFLFILFLIISTFKIFPDSYKIGMTRIYSQFKKYHPEFHFELENSIMSVISDLPSKGFFALNINEDTQVLENIINAIKENSDDIHSVLNNSQINIINELKDVDICMAFKIGLLRIKKEMDFYDTDKYWTIITSEINIIIIDTRTNILLEKINIEIETRSSKDLKNAVTSAVNKLTLKVKNFINGLTLFKTKLYPLKSGPLFIRLNKGINDGIRTQNILISYTDNKFVVQEKSVIKIIRSNDETSIGTVLYSNGKITGKDFFTKSQKIDLEIQLAGGFVLADPENPVLTTNPYISILSFGSVRALIPVRLPYFRPTVQFELNFFYQDNKVLLPFSFETGCQGEFNIHRFGIDGGFTIGALFSPDNNNTYQLDSIIIRPYIHLSGLIITNIEMFGEFGYKYLFEGNFYQNWNIDLKGPYFSFGIGVNL